MSIDLFLIRTFPFSHGPFSARRCDLRPGVKVHRPGGGVRRGGRRTSHHHHGDRHDSQQRDGHSAGLYSRSVTFPTFLGCPTFE